MEIKFKYKVIINLKLGIKEGELIFPYFPIIVLKGPLALV